MAGRLRFPAIHGFAGAELGLLLQELERQRLAGGKLCYPRAKVRALRFSAAAVSAFPAVVRTTAFDDARGSGWKRHEQFTIRRAQNIFCN